MIAIFELGSLAFWALLVAAFIVVIAAQEVADSPGSWSTFWVILTLAILYLCGSKMSIEQFGMHILHEPVRLVAGFLLYTIAGTIWSFYKWKELVNEAVEAYKEKLNTYLENRKLYANSRWDSPRIDDYKPKLVRNKAKLFNWIFYWPFSFTWFLVHEPIERLFRFIMEKTKKVYEGITDRAFEKVVKPKEDDMVHK